jgi:hypothetical protein
LLEGTYGNEAAQRGLQQSLEAAELPSF